MILNMPNTSTVVFNKSDGIIAQVFFDDDANPNINNNQDIIHVPTGDLRLGPQYFKVAGGKIVPLDDVDKISLDTMKRRRYGAIDAVTDKIIARGFTFSGMRFSESVEAQSRALALDQLRDDPKANYPILWNNDDDTDVLQITDATMLHNFVLAGIAYYSSAIDSGSALKLQIRQATTVAAVLAVIDTRTKG